MTDEVERIKLAGQIDISCVQAFHTLKEIDEMIEIAKKYGFAAVFTLPAFSAHVAERLRDCKEIHTGGVVSFPGGGDTIEQKKRQAKELWETGCEEVDMVMNLTALKSQEFSYIKEELTAVREAIPTAILKVIIEAPHLTEAEIRQAVELCKEARADYAKTSTGWYPEYPSTVEQVRIMSEAAKGRIRIKAAGGVRTLVTIREMQRVGCSRFGLGMKSAETLMERWM